MPPILRLVAAFGLCFIIVMVLPGQVMANGGNATIIVSQSGEGQFTKISQALKYANPDETILVKPGVYKESLIINKSVTLVGEGEPTIDGEGDGTVITVVANDTTINGFRIIDTGTAESLEPSAIKIIRSSHVVVEKNTVSQAFFGIYLQGASDVTVYSNELVGLPEIDMNSRGLGIYLWNAHNNKIIMNSVNYFKDGYYNDHSYSNVIANDSTQYGRYGVHLMYCSNYLVENVTSKFNVVGMALMYSQNVTAHNNIVAKNWGAVGYGIFTTSDDNLTLDGNLVYGNVYGMIFNDDPYTSSGYALVGNNTIAFNYIGVSLDDQSHAVFRKNSIIENVEDLLIIGNPTNSSTWFGNFWGDYLSQAINNGRVVVSDPMQDLVDGYPQLRLYMYSPAYLSLEAVVNTLPVNPLVKAVDLHPSLRPVAQLLAKRSFSVSWFFASILLILAPLGVIIQARKTGMRRREIE